MKTYEVRLNSQASVFKLHAIPLGTDRRRLTRQSEIKRRTVIQFTFRTNRPGVGAHHMFRDGQAQAGASRLP